MAEGTCRVCGEAKKITDSGRFQGTVIPHGIRVDGERRGCPGSWKYPTTVEPMLFLSAFRAGEWSGTICDRIICGEPPLAPGGRFCAGHQREHGARLLAGLGSARDG